MAVRTNYFDESTGQSTSTSSTYADKCSLTFTPAASKNYLLLAAALSEFVSSSSPINGVRLNHDTAGVVMNGIEVGTFTAGTRIGFSGMSQYAAPGSPSSQTFSLEYARLSGSGSTGIEDARLFALEMGANDHYSETLTENSYTGAQAWVDGHTASISIPASGDYLLIACCDARANSGGNRHGVRLWDNDNSVAYGAISKECKNTSDYVSWFFADVFTFTSGTKTFKIQQRPDGYAFGNIRIRNMKVAVIDLSQFAGYWNASSLSASTTTSTSDQTKLSHTFTPNAADCLVIQNALVAKTSGSNRASAEHRDGSTQEYGTFDYGDSNGTNVGSNPITLVDKRTLSASSTTYDTRYKIVTSGTVAIHSAVSIVIDLNEAGGSPVTYTVTAALNAAIQKQDIPRTASLSAALQKQNILRTLTLGAAIQKNMTVAATVSAALLKAGVIRTATADSALQKTGILKTLTLNAALSLTRLTTASLNAVLQKTVAATATTDAALKKDGVTRTASVNAGIQNSPTASTTISAGAQKAGLTKAATSDAAISKTTGLTASLSAAIFRGGVSLSSAVDAVVVRSYSVSATIAAAILKSVTKSAAVDSALQKQGIATTASTSAALSRTGAATATLSAALQKTAALSASLNAALAKNRTATATSDAALKKTDILITSTLAAALRKTASLSASLDAYLVATASGNTRAAVLNAALQKTMALNSTLNAAILRVNQKTAALDSALMRPGILKTATVSAALVKVRVVTGLVDAVLRRTRTVTAAVDCAVKRTGNALVVAVDAYVIQFELPDSANPIPVTAHRFGYEVPERESEAVVANPVEYAVPERQGFSASVRRPGFKVKPR